MIKSKLPQRFEFEVNMVERNSKGKPIMSNGQIKRRTIKTNSAAKVAAIYRKFGGR